MKTKATYHAGCCQYLDCEKCNRKRNIRFEIPATPLCMNVSEKADAVFMRELHRNDPQRHANLLRNVRRVAGACSLRRRQAHKGGRPRKHKNNAAKCRAYRLRKRKNGQGNTKPVSSLLITGNLQTQNSNPAIPIA